MYIIKTSTKQTEVKHLYSIIYSKYLFYSPIPKYTGCYITFFENVYIFIKNNLHTGKSYEEKKSALHTSSYIEK